MKNRISKDPDRFVVDDGTDGGPWAKFTWDDGKLIVDSFCEIHLTHKTIREFSAWLSESQIANQGRKRK